MYKMEIFFIHSTEKKYVEREKRLIQYLNVGGNLPTFSYMDCSVFFCSVREQKKRKFISPRGKEPSWFFLYNGGFSMLFLMPF
jgi:hypothetical protein